MDRDDTIMGKPFATTVANAKPKDRDYKLTDGESLLGTSSEVVTRHPEANFSTTWIKAIDEVAMDQVARGPISPFCRTHNSGGLGEYMPIRNGSGPRAEPGKSQSGTFLPNVAPMIRWSMPLRTPESAKLMPISSPAAPKKPPAMVPLSGESPVKVPVN